MGATRSTAGRGGGGTEHRAPAPRRRRGGSQLGGRASIARRSLAALVAAVLAASDAGGARAQPAAPGSPATSPSAAAANAPLAAAAGPAYGLHVVRPGETMWRLAAGYGMRAAALAALNGVPPTALLLPGRPLRVPMVNAANARAASPAGAAPGGLVRTLQADVTGAGGDDVAATTDYEVVLGDTLLGIADRFDADVEAIKRRNGLPADGSIWEGQTLRVPVRGDGAAAGDGVPGAPTSPADTPSRPVPKTDTVTVAAGDTLSSIAARFGTTAAALMRLNGLDGDAIAAGQTLYVPRAGSGAPAGTGAKRIEVDIGDQRMYVWEGGTLVFNWTASTGLATHPTRTGSFAVQSKEPNAWSSAWQLWMPHWLGIYWAGGSENGIHALPVINGATLWGGMLGSPVSYGCVVLDTPNAETLYNWADLGTPVEIHD